ncbi:ShlB/FhaC/HecB family hemolysin secretion/activation protein [Selenomonas dianae]|uniref:ShlB/FhaC/HecB family hemolysin secretion/activation protein n=1 Tax=Selenomonas dianae TaxID=135079 RepID=A0ABN0T2B0_9FIRM|nr:ShlB/FhaC/HecB family hemolysin secretion/activation protein [Selenomonas dianae]WLD81976.1 ShlB/FhaC/HecB family hemolysin secretion/activation protein [Selenomonas dianae]
MEKGMMLRAGLAACICAGLAAQGTAGLAAPSLARPGADVASEQPPSEIGVEDGVPRYRQDGDDAQFTIENFIMEAPDLVLDKDALSRILSEGMGEKRTMAQLRQTVDELTSYCRSHGYPAAAVYLPPQESTDGVVVLRVLPGRYDEIAIENKSRLRTPVARRIIAGLKTGDIITTERLETALYGVSDATGARAVGVLSPGREFGTSKLTVRIEDSKESNTVFYVENYGSPSTGRYRYGLQETLYDPSGTGDKVNLGTLISNGSLRNFYANYETVVGHGGSTLGIGVSRMNYKVGRELSPIGAEGNSLTLTLFGQAPLYHLTERSLIFRYGYNYRNLNDDITGFDLRGKKHTHSLYAGLVGMQRSRGLMLNYTANLTVGSLGLDSDYSRVLGALNHTEDGTYAKLEADVTAVQQLGHSTDFMVKVSGQKASRNLDSSEEFYLGGPNGVRAYAQGEGTGDEGALGTAELRWRTPLRGLTLSTFYDAGAVRVSKGMDGADRVTLRGWGFGAAYSEPGDWFARLDYAKRIGLDSSVSVKNNAKNRVWFMAGKIW